MPDATGSVRALVTSLADASGVDVVDVQVKGAGSRMLLRVVVDRKGGIDLGSCEKLSRSLSQALDAEDPFMGRYVLEVTSPGVDWPLTDQAAFDRVDGRLVLVHWRQAGESSVRQLCGTVTAAHAEAVAIDVDGETVSVPYGEIVKATQALPW